MLEPKRLVEATDRFRDGAMLLARIEFIRGCVTTGAFISEQYHDFQQRSRMRTYVSGSAAPPPSAAVTVPSSKQSHFVPTRARIM